MASKRVLLDALAALVVTTSGAARSAHGVAHGHHGGPVLDPTVAKPHSYFFKHDYPRDFSPSAGKLDNSFSHPYPAVQDTDDYEKDYVKDENSDTGEWKAQHDYDELRTRLDKLAAEARMAEQRKRDLERQLDSLMKDKKNLDDKSKELGAKRKRAARVAEDEVRRADEDYEKLKASDKEESGKVGAADKRTDVSGAISKLEECQRELEETQAKLKKLQAERLQAQKDANTAMVKERNTMSLEFAKQKAEAQLEAQVEKDATIHDKALAKYQKEQADLVSFQERLARAEAKLRSFRRTEVDQGGGVYREESGAPRPGPPWLLAVLPAVLLALLSAGL